jgi:serine/threonine protein kinase
LAIKASQYSPEQDDCCIVLGREHIYAAPLHFILENRMTGLEGKTIDRYKLQQLAGRGGMADVYMAEDTQFTRRVAIKVFQREDEDLLRRFVREARMMAALRSPHLIPVYDAGTHELNGTNFYYIVMPMMESGTLRDLIQRAPLSLQTAGRYMRDIADALDYIHRQGIIHRDIKASNVLLDEEGRCYLSDFGIARTTADDSHMTSTGSILGTVLYMAPELFEGNQRATPSSDIYALGILLFEMVTGRVPFTGDSLFAVMSMHTNKVPPTPSSIVANIPPMVDQVILKALEKQPALRYHSATELAEAFYQAATLPQQTPEARIADTVWAGDNNSTVITYRNETQTVLASPEQRSTPSLPVGQQSLALDDAKLDQYPTLISDQASAYPHAPRPLKRKQGRVIAIVALIILLIVLAPIGYVLYTHSTSSHASTSTTTSPSTANAVPPQPGRVQYTVQSGDQCDEILSEQMQMTMATQIFNDSKPATVQALNAALGHDCNLLQSGLVLPLSPQYPLVAIKGQVLKIETMNAQQTSPNCATDCRLLVSIAPQVQVQVTVKTQLKVQVNSSIWAQAMMARKSVPGFDNYPYVDPNASMAGMSLSACDLQVDAVHDNDSLGCNQITPNTIDSDGGSWMFGVTGPEGLDHWNYQLHLPAGTRVLLWLTKEGNSLNFHTGNPIYRYDEATHAYVKA